MSTQTREELVSVDEARSLILSHIWDVESESAGIVNALGKTLTSDVTSELDIPPFMTSSVDGYALIASDTKGTSDRNPRKISIMCEITSGSYPAKEIVAGTAASLSTGTALPKGADAVVLKEDCYRDNASLYVLREVQSYENIKPAGQEIRKGDVVLTRGTVLGPVHLGLLAALGLPGVPVMRKPRIAVITLGRDVVDIVDDITEGKTRNCNRYILVGQVLASGCELGPLVHVRDERASLPDALKRSLRADAVIISGGSVMSERDPVRDIISSLGRIHLSRVAMKPGKSFAFATIDSKPVFVLPQDPVSSMVAFEMFVRPSLLKMLGRKDLDRPMVTAVLKNSLKQFLCHRQFVPARTVWESGKFTTEIIDAHTSGLPKSLLNANSLIVMREDREDLRRGDTTEVLMLEP